MTAIARLGGLSALVFPDIIFESFEAEMMRELHEMT
jgi:hypothetical protein